MMDWNGVEMARSSVGVHRTESRPDGGFSLEEYQQRYGLSYGTANSQIHKMLKAGVLKRVKCRAGSTSGRPVWVYFAAPKGRKGCA